jgi:hypothetical protein
MELLSVAKSHDPALCDLPKLSLLFLGVVWNPYGLE